MWRLGKLFLILSGIVCFTGNNTLLSQPLSAILPKNQSYLNNFNVSYQWNAYPNAISYKVVQAGNLGFTANLSTSPSINTTSWSSFVNNQGTYYWKVIAYTANDSASSPIYSFNYFTPSSLQSTSLWLKADAGITLDASNKVQQWLDLSTNAFTMSQALAAKRPTVVNNVVNGYPSLAFSGSQFLSGGDILDLGFNSRSMFVIGKMASTNQTLLAKSRAANATFRYGIIKDVASTAFLFQSDNNTSNYSATNTTNYALYNAFVNRTTAKNHFDLNNVSLGINSFNSNLLFESTYRFLIGAYNNANDDGEVLMLNGNICEIVFSDSNDSLDINKIKNYLKFKYTPVFDLGPDVSVVGSFCPQTINAPAGYTNYSWNTGANTATISVSQSGTYIASAFDAFGFKWTDSIVVQFPQIAPPSTTAICANGSIQWNLGLGAGYNYLWNTGSTASSLTITQAGTYSVSITGAGACAYNSGPTLFTVDNFPNTATLGNDTSLCAGNIIGLQIGAQQTASYLWNDGSNNTTYTVNNTGSIQVSLIATSVNGCIAMDTISIQVSGTAPSINLTLPAAFCTNAPILINNNSSVPAPANIVSQDWLLSNGSQYSGGTIQVQNQSSGWLYGSITVTASDNCSSVDTFSFYVHEPPGLLINHNGNCSNEPIVFLASDTLGQPLSSFNWTYVVNGITDQDTIGEYIFNAGGNQQITLIAGNNFACYDTLTYNLTLNLSPTANFSVNNACEDSNIAFNNQSVDNDGAGFAATYWDFNDGNLDSNSQVSHAYDTEGNYLCQLIVLSNNGCSDTITQSISIYPSPDLSWTIGSACKDNLTAFQSTSSIPTGTIDSTSWIVNLQYPTIGSSGNYIFTTLGIQYLQLSATSNLGCTRDTLILIDVHPSITSAFDYNPNTVVVSDLLTLNSLATGNDSIAWFLNGNYLDSENNTSFFIDDSLSGQIIEITSVTYNQFGCVDSSTYEIVVNQAILDLAVNQVYLDNVNGISYVGCEVQNLGTIPIPGYQLILSLTGVPLISESILDTLSPNQTAYYVFSGNPQLNGLNQNQKDDFVCVEAKSSLNPTLNDINYENNTRCQLLEDAGFSLSNIRPNPAENNIESWLVVGEESEITFEIINMLGESCLIVNRNYTPGTFSIDIDVSHLSAGSYFLWVSSTNKKKILQFIRI